MFPLQYRTRLQLPPKIQNCKLHAESAVIPKRLCNRLQHISTNMDKQYDLLKLIVQKMEIVTEADDYDEGEEDLTGRKRPAFHRLSVKFSF